MIEDFPELLGPLITRRDADIMRFWTMGPQLSTASEWWQDCGVVPPPPTISPPLVLSRREGY